MAILEEAVDELPCLIELFETASNPFATPNATDEEMDLMPWAVDWKGRLP